MLLTQFIKQQIKKATLLNNLIFYSIRPFYVTIYLSILVKKTMELLRQHIKPGEVYRRSDLSIFRRPLTNKALQHNLGL